MEEVRAVRRLTAVCEPWVNDNATTSKPKRPLGPKVFAICVVRDEADVIEETLRAASLWADRIFVLDNGSDDETWKIVQAVADDSSVVVAHQQDPTPFTDNIRAKVFGAFSHEARNGDWWCRLDADEHYIDPPSVFLRKVPDRYEAVYASTFCYYFSDRDFASYRQDPAAWLTRPVAERLRWYRNGSVEQRFVRHRATKPWVDTAWPDRRLRPYPTPIWLRHYQYRSPGQIERRYRVRTGIPQPFTHEFTENEMFPFAPTDGEPWRRRLADHRLLDYDVGDLRLVPRVGNSPVHRPTPSATKVVRRALRSLAAIKTSLPGRR
jgi:Glycosyl transferase family 2